MNFVCACTASNLTITFPKSFGNYNVLEQVGFGISSAVVLVENQNTHKIYAAKIIPNMLNFNELAIQEVAILKTLKHPNIVKFYDSFTIKDAYKQDLFIIITEYYENGSLSDYIFNPKEDKIEDRIKIATSILSAIQYLHSRGIAHCDIKPENVLFDSKMNPILIDFGFSIDNVNTTDSQYRRGTTGYAAPELFQRTTSINLKVADIYSIGIVLDHLFIKKNLFMNKQTKINNQDKTSDLTVKKLIKDCLEFDPIQRPTIEEILNNKFFNKTESYIGEENDEKKVRSISNIN